MLMAATLQLSPRQREILILMARGLTQKQIARFLKISPFTVRNHRHTIFAKLGAMSASQALARAISTGQVAPEELEEPE